MLRSRWYSSSVVCLALLVTMIGIGSGRAFAQGRPLDVVYLTSTLGSGSYEMAQLISKTIGQQKSPKLKLTAPETPGYVYNLKLMVASPDKWRNHIFAASTGSTWLGEVGLQPLYDKRYVFPDAKILMSNAIWSMFFITLDPSIKTLADAKGKRIALGLRGQSHWGGLGMLWLEVSGITPENSKIDFLGPMNAAEALLDGRVDVAVTGVGLEPSLQHKFIFPPLNHVTASGKAFHYLMPAPTAIDRLNKERGAPFVLYKFPAGFLPGQPAEMISAADVDVMLVHSNFPEPAAYDYTKLLIGIAPDMGKYHATGKLWTREMLTFGLTEANTHKGSIRAFKEAGLWKDKPQ